MPGLGAGVTANYTGQLASRRAQWRPGGDGDGAGLESEDRRQQRRRCVPMTLQPISWSPRGVPVHHHDREPPGGGVVYRHLPHNLGASTVISI